MVPSDRAACPSGLRATNPARSASDIRRDDEDDEPFTAMISPNRCGRLLYFLWAGDLPPFIYRDTRSLLIMSNRPALNTPPLLPRSDGKEGPLLAISPIPWSEGGHKGRVCRSPLPATVSSVCVFYRLLPPLSCTSSSASAHMFTKMRLGRPPETHPRMGCFAEGEFLLSRRGRRKEGSAGRSLQTRAITQSTNKICRFSGRENRWLQCHLLKHQLCSSSPAFSSRHFTYTTAAAAAHAHTHT